MSPAATAPYKVLARKYRPRDFAGLIGQEALVRTLSNAIRQDRLAHAFILTGVRGVGKTTTARIIARALNCIGPDGSGGPTVEPCGVCEHCLAISEDRHVDVVEMDAASNNSVDNVREIVEAARYRPVSARYKIYILDEVHMLSNQAFNALLKTLEEPPAHVKFVFATTEIRRVPVTVLSRCQRFDLRRIETPVLLRHFEAVVREEAVEIAPEAMAMIVRAADGSVRDGLSLLDQAIAHGSGRVTAEQVREMLGLADRQVVFDLFEALMRGDTGGALEVFDNGHAAGADPVQVVQDLMELAHWVTRAKVDPASLDDPTVPEAERMRGRTLADSLGMAVLTRAWQMLLKGLRETQSAPAPKLAVDMLIVRLTHAAELPTPAEMIERLSGEGKHGGDGAGERRPATATPAMGDASRPATSDGAGASGREAPGPRHDGDGPRARLAVVPAALPEEEPAAEPESVGLIEPAITPPEPESEASEADTVAAGPAGHGIEGFDALVRTLEGWRTSARLVADVRRYVHLIDYTTGRLEFRPAEGAPSTLAGELRGALEATTGRQWTVSVGNAEGAATLKEREREAAERRRRDAERHPLVLVTLQTFPGARIRAVREIERTDASGDREDEPLSAPPVEEEDEEGDTFAIGVDGPPIDPEDPGPEEEWS